MHTIYLLLGSNESGRMAWLRNAIELLQQHCGEVTDRSAIYETAAWGLEDQPDFLNMALCLNTKLSPEELLQCTQSIEQQLGRQRTIKWGQRTLDIDILFYDKDIIDIPGLKVPHPYIQDRRFALVPLADIAPGFVHPQLHKTIAELLEICPDPLPVTKHS
ncbi:MAG: 2-amino-4-hydroxy-6-hydroxymethyldihydropteridine diphosphokinase [Bacteroidetes bacterium 46-16]|nr:MAG: 2-amino-4-hydroxy-6-hydroxymethyldihydropteridine diphosphokinase [Bacteroidetes bacterium 46-16]